MRNAMMHKTRLALLGGAFLAIGLAGCNRERDQMETEPSSASTAGAATMTEPMPTDTMATDTASLPPSAVTSAADVTAEAPPTEGGLNETGDPASASTVSAPMDDTETQQPPTDGNPTR